MAASVAPEVYGSMPLLRDLTSESVQSHIPARSLCVSSQLLCEPGRKLADVPFRGVHHGELCNGRLSNLEPGADLISRYIQRDFDQHRPRCLSMHLNALTEVTRVLHVLRALCTEAGRQTARSRMMNVQQMQQWRSGYQQGWNQGVQYGFQQGYHYMYQTRLDTSAVTDKPVILFDLNGTLVQRQRTGSIRLRPGLYWLHRLQVSSPAARLPPACARCVNTLAAQGLFCIGVFSSSSCKRVGEIIRAARREAPPNLSAGEAQLFDDELVFSRDHTQPRLCTSRRPRVGHRQAARPASKRDRRTEPGAARRR